MEATFRQARESGPLPTPSTSRGGQAHSIAVIGLGVLGGAVERYFRDAGWTVRVYDRYKKLGSVHEVNEADIIFICVPTPYVHGSGLDTTVVESAIAPLDGSKTVVIRSTVPPGTTVALQTRYPQHRLLFNPEFLREKTAMEDFLHPDRQIVGCCDGDEALADSILELLPNAPYQRVLPATAAELVKMSTNAFLALKVTFANQIFDVAEALGVDFDLAREGIAADPRIGPSHMDVFDGGYRGYGGKCLPKDTIGLVDLASSLGARLTLLQTVHELNQQLGLEPAPSRKAA